MDKNGVVTFGDWNKGQVKHPIYGFGLLQNVEVFENKGIAKLKNRFTPRTSITPTATPIAEIYDVSGNTYTLTGETGSGACYKNGVSIQSGLGLWGDLAIYKNYLWVRYSTVLSAYGPLDSGGAQWFGNIVTGFNGNYIGKLLVGQDDYLYSGNGNFVTKMDVTSSGTPGVAPTMSQIIASAFTQLDLPDGQFVTTLKEYGTKIIVGTQGGASYADRGNSSTARLYPWSRQAGTLGNPGLADLPVVFSENGVNALLQHANKLYVSAGTNGNIYVTDGTNYEKIATLPFAKTGVFSNSTVYVNAMDISEKGTLLVGLSGYADGYSKAGVYEIDITNSEYPVAFRTISTLSTGTSSVLKIGFIHSTNFQTTNIGWSDGTTYGVDTSDFRMFSSYGGVIETPLVKVGQYNLKKTFEHIEFNLAEPLVTGQNLRVSYRKNSNEAYTVLNTWGFSTLGAVISFEDIAPIADCEYIQLKIELDQSVATLYGSNINLISVRIW